MGHEALAALDVRDGSRECTVELEQVEDHEHDRHLAAARSMSAGLRQVHPLLQAAEVGSPLPVERDDLRIENRLMAADRIGDGRELGIGLRQVVAVATGEPHDRVGGRVDLDECADAVPFHLECPVVARG